MRKTYQKRFAILYKGLAHKLPPLHGLIQSMEHCIDKWKWNYTIIGITIKTEYVSSLLSGLRLLQGWHGGSFAIEKTVYICLYPADRFRVKIAHILFKH